MMRAWFRGAGASLIALCLISPVSGQGIIPSVIGSTIANMQAADARAALCLSGHAPKAKKIALVRGRAEAAMRDYMHLAVSWPPMDGGGAFTSKAKLRSWSSDGKPGRVEAIDDPLARWLAGAGLAPPKSFVLAGDLRSARGLWVVGGAKPRGYYRVSFRPEGPFLPEGGQIWRITSLELITGPDEPAAVTQYCSKPGDVEEYAVAMAKLKEERERRKAEKAARRAAAQGR